MQPMPLVGIDVTSVARVTAVRQRRPEFARRFFTAAEAQRCAEAPQRWATRWAAKEAVRKLAGAAGLALPRWRDIEVVVAGSGVPLALVRGWAEPISLSLSHDGDTAVAVAVSAAPPLRLADIAAVRLPDRGASAHKGTFGTVVVVAGSRGFTGAAYLAAMGAARGGAGLVRLCVPESVYPIAAGRCIEVMAHPLADVGGGFSPAAVMQFCTEQLVHADAVVIGCGMGQRPGTVTAVVELLPLLTVPAVIDADALNILAAQDFDWRRCRHPLVVTPHPAEMARLVGVDTAAIQANRSRAAREFAVANGVVVALKGAGTVIAAPDGRVHVDDHDVVALASAGTGDVLAGLTGAMLGQGLDAFDAAIAAVTIHAEAGRAVQLRCGRAGGLASDVLDALPQAQERIRRSGEVLP